MPRGKLGTINALLEPVRAGGLHYTAMWRCRRGEASQRDPEDENKGQLRVLSCKNKVSGVRKEVKEGKQD